MVIQFHEDNNTACIVLKSGYSGAMRGIGRNHGVKLRALAERFKSGAHRPTRGSQHDLDPCHRRPVPVRPASAAPRPLGLPVTDTARTDALLQSYIDMHKESAEQHNMALQEALLEKIRVHKERTQTRRNAQRSTMQLRREASRDFAVQLQHPFVVKQARGPRERAAPPWGVRAPVHTSPCLGRALRHT